MRLHFLDGLCVTSCDVLGFSLGGMVAQQMALDRPSSIHRMILVGTAPRGGEDIMHLEKPSLARHLGDPTLKGYAVLQKIFFAPTSSSQAAGGAFIERLAQRKEDLDPPSGPDVAAAQMAAFREWEQPAGSPLRRSQGHPSAHARRQRHPRRNDSRLELLSVGREPSERRASRVPGLRTRLPVPVSRVLHPARGGIPRVGRAVRAVLIRFVVSHQGGVVPVRGAVTRWTRASNGPATIPRESSDDLNPHATSIPRLPAGPGRRARHHTARDRRG